MPVFREPAKQVQPRRPHEPAPPPAPPVGGEDPCTVALPGDPAYAPGRNPQAARQVAPKPPWWAEDGAEQKMFRRGTEGRSELQRVREILASPGVVRNSARGPWSDPEEPPARYLAGHRDDVRQGCTYTVRDVARQLGVSVTTVKRAQRKGVLPRAPEYVSGPHGGRKAGRYNLDYILAARDVLRDEG